MISAEQLAATARAALTEEASLSPKPGLVTPLSCGAHRDMDYDTFLRSALALEPCFCCIAAFGLTGTEITDEAALSAIRAMGQEGERQMFAATAGVNTHKGALFSMGLALFSAARLISGGLKPFPDVVLGNIAALCHGLTEHELAPLKRCPPEKPTAGEKLYLQYGCAGIRGEAELGFPAVRTALVQMSFAASRGFSRTQSLCLALLAVMSEAEDTNVLSRCGLKGLQYMHKSASKALSRCQNCPEQIKPTMSAMEVDFVKRWMSPGGCADTLALAIFLESICRSE